MSLRAVKFRPRFNGSAIHQLRAALVDVENGGIEAVVIAVKRPTGIWSLRNSLIKDRFATVGALEYMKSEIMKE